MSPAPRRRRTKYGRRPDGRARDPFKNTADAQAIGYDSAADFRRQRGERLNVSPAVALGHGRRTGEVGLSELAEFELTVIATRPTGAYLHHDMGTLEDTRKAGKADALVRQLQEGRITPEQFRRRTERLGPIAGVEPESDAFRALAVARRAQPEDWRFYPRSRGQGL